MASSETTPNYFTTLVLEKSKPLVDLASDLYGDLDKQISPRVFSLLRDSLGFNVTSSPVLQHLPGVASPTPIVLACTVYLLVVLAGLLYVKATNGKPRSSDPLPLKAFVLVHNLFLVGLSLFMFDGIVLEAAKNKYTVWGNAYKPQQVKMAHFIYIFYISKVYEFLDTVIMVLKGNVRQISFLHVYHHLTISLIWWLTAYTAPGGEAYFSAAMNSLVHVAMYLYYFLSAALGKENSNRDKYLWWGRYLTQMQMTQFALNILQAAYGLITDGPYPNYLFQILFYYMFTLLALFANFFLNKFSSKSKPRPKRKKKAQ